MTGDDKKRDPLGVRIDTIEEVYEFMLAYAGQGLEGEGEGGQGPSIRDFLQRADAALDDLGAVAAASVEARSGEPAERHRPFLDVLAEDARKAQAAFRLVLARPSISSQTIDNLNASIHVRALLTDLFLIDEALPEMDAG